MNYNFVVMETFGKWLLRHRKALDFKQEDVATRAGISISYVSTLERDQPNTSTGDSIRPEPDVVENIAKAVNGDVAEALAFFGYASREAVKTVRDRIKVSDFDGFDKNDLDDIANYIAYKRALKDKEKERE